MICETTALWIEEFIEKTRTDLCTVCVNARFNRIFRCNLKFFKNYEKMKYIYYLNATFINENIYQMFLE